MILIVNLNREYLGANLPVYIRCSVNHQLLAALNLCLVVVTNNVIGASRLAITIDALQIEEAVIALSELRTLRRWKQLVEAHDCLRCIDHLTFCGTCVNRKSVSTHKHLSGIERLVAKLAKGTTVNGVTIRSTKSVKIQKSCAVANLLIRNKRKRNTWVLELWMLLVASEQAYQHSNASLVIATKQRSTISSNKLPANHVLKLRISLRANVDLSTLAIRTNYQLAALIYDYLRVNGIAPRLPSRINVAAETKSWKVLQTLACWPVSNHISVLVNGYIFCTKLTKISCNNFSHLVLRIS